MREDSSDFAVLTPTRTIFVLAGFDVRIALDVDLAKFEEMLHQWCKDAGPDYTIEFAQVNSLPLMHSLD